MISIEKASELHSQVSNLLRNEQLMKALTKLKTLVDEAEDWNLRQDFENLESTYQRMLGFIEQNMVDPDRGKMYYNLLTKGMVLNDRLLRAIQIQLSTTLYYKTIRETIRQAHLTSLYNATEWLKNRLAIPSLSTEEFIKVQHDFFHVLWTSDIWSPSERENITQLLDTIPENMGALFVSAVTLGLMEMYDPQKFLFLLDTYNHPADTISQRALVGIALGCVMHDNRLRSNEEVGTRLMTMTDNSQFEKELQFAQMQLLRSRETAKISKFMNEEFIPEMMKNPILKKDKTGLDSLSVEDVANPEWEKWIESKDVKNKMHIMNELYNTGADIHMASFANMKNFPFFKEIANWFIPFDTTHPAIAIASEGQEEVDPPLIRQLIEGSEFCDSDCYSLYLFLASLPKDTRQIMGKQMPAMTDEVKEQLKELHAKHNSRANLCKKYTQNLYRFYKLFGRKHEFTDLFEEETNLQYTDTLQPFVNNEQHIAEVAGFLFNQKYYEEAEIMYAQLEIASVPTFETSQKRGFCLQQLKQYEKAIEQYEKAELIHPNNLWNLIHLAQCYHNTEQIEKATQCYLMAEEIAPDDLSLQLQTGNCLAKTGRYEEAFKRFFKVHYLNEKSTTVWRAIAWYSLMAGRMDQAEKFYTLIEENGGKENANDLLNIGHMHWLNKRYSQAISYYRQCCLMVGEDSFNDMISNDADDLIMMDIPPMDLPLIIDLVKVKNG